MPLLSPRSIPTAPGPLRRSTMTFRLSSNPPATIRPAHVRPVSRHPTLRGLPQQPPHHSPELVNGPPAWRWCSPTAETRPSEVTAGRAAMESEKLLDCPVCMTEAMPPFMQCSNGHLVCNTCLPNVLSCPVCRVATPFVRNILLEKFLGDYLFACIYRSNGCPQRVSLAERKTHEAACDHRDVDCFLKCGWTGKPTEVLIHMVTTDRVASFVGNSVALDLASLSSLPVDESGRLQRSNVCLMSAYSRQFVVIVAKKSSPAPSRSLCELAIKCVDITVASDRPKFEAKFFYSSNRDSSIMSWSHRVAKDLSEMPHCPGYNFGDGTLKVTIQPVAE